MIKFGAIRSDTRMGKVLRLPLRLIPQNAVLPVLQGPAKRLKIVVGSGIHGYWLGSWEANLQETLVNELHPGDVFYDVGAHVGFFSMIASRLVGDSGRVFSFEPSARTYALLARHLEMNRIDNVEACEAAVGEHTGVARFEPGGEVGTDRVVEAGGQEVDMISLDDFVFAQGKTPPSVMKIDVEGHEVQVLQGARRLLREFHPELIIEIHSEEAGASIKQMLEDEGYWLAEDEGLKKHHLKDYMMAKWSEKGKA